MVYSTFVDADLLEELGREFDSMANTLREHISMFTVKANIGNGYGHSEPGMTTTSHYDATKSVLIDYLNLMSDAFSAQAYRLKDSAIRYRVTEQTAASHASLLQASAVSIYGWT